MLTAIAGIVLGMGMPTTPAYIVMVSLLVPALIKLGAIAPAAHMFAFYFAILSAITPPVALAVFAAASLAKTDLWTTGWEAVRIGAAGFIVPFMFVYEPSLLMIGDWQDIASSFITATIGTILLAASLQGYLIRSATMWQRVILFVAALCLIKPGWITDLIGLALLAVVLASQYLEKKKRSRMKQPEVLIIGSGVMGRGIAKSFVSAGIPTAILSRNVANVTAGVDERVALVEKLPPDAPELIIEAVPEKMALKLKSYAAIEAAYAGKPVLASNTSTLDLEELARPLQHPERFLAIHYFMPADVNAVVEVAPVRATSPAATDAAVRLIEASRQKRGAPEARRARDC